MARYLEYLIILYVFVAFMGCSERAQLVETEPPASELTYFQSELRLHFDKPVTSVQVNDASAQPMCSPPTRDWEMNLQQVGAIWLTPGAYPAQEVCLVVSYTDESGTHEQELCNWLPSAVVESPVAELIESSVEDGDIGVDPALLNMNGITFRFSELVTGTIEIRMEDGTLLDWFAIWNIRAKVGDLVTIFPATGQELANGASYIVEFSVRDVPGNGLSKTITFTTRQ